MQVKTCETENVGQSTAVWTPQTLAIDPGISTGFVYISNDGSIVERGTIVYADLLPKLVNLHNTRSPQIVIIERLPTNLTRAMRNVSTIVQNIFPDREGVLHSERVHYTRVEISPGEWKPITGKLPLPFSPSTQHEKDAYRMAAHWLIKNGFMRRPEVI